MASFDRRLAEHLRKVIAAANVADHLSEPVTVERKYHPKLDVTALAVPVVTVAHGLQQRVTASRAHQKRTHTIRVALQATLEQSEGQVSDDRCDELSDLTETLMDVLTAAASFEGAALSTIDTQPFYDPDAMDSPGIWQGILTVTYTRIAK